MDFSAVGLRSAHRRIVMAGLDPAIPIMKAQPFHTIGIAGTSPAMTAENALALFATSH
jgi:hypothetical protein